MSDFQDFLTHSIAQVAIGEFKLGKFEEAQQLYQEAVSTYTSGFRGAYLLRERGSERGISVIFWDDEETMAANNNEVHQAILKKMAPLFSATPVVDAYEVVSEILPLKPVN
jgi:heme-degrading monooxygenase HmoA